MTEDSPATPCSFANRRALISGGGSGIGRATALLLAQAGARVAVTDWDYEAALAVAAELASAGGEALPLALDVTTEAAWDRATAEVERVWGGLDTVVLSAGIIQSSPIAETNLADWQRVMAVNLDGVFLGVKHCLPLLRASGGGSIVIVSSASGVKATPGASAYCASKAALRLFARCAALECAQAAEGVRVNCVLPGGVETPLWKEAPFWANLVAEHGEAGAWQALAASTPLKRFAHPDEVARAILYLASDAAAYITGTELVIDGGFTA